MKKPSSGLPPNTRRTLRLTMTRGQTHREMNDEVAFHFEMRVAELRALGMNELDAQAEALRRFGDTAEFDVYAARRAEHRIRRARVFEWGDELVQDVRFAIRQSRKNIAFTVIAVLTLALGIGANAAIFSVVHRLLIAPLPYPNGNRIVRLMMTDGARNMDPPGRSVLAWRDRAHSFEMIAAMSVDAIATDSREEQDSVHAEVTPNFLDLVAMHPVLGRGFRAEDALAEAAPVAIISNGVWQRRYGGRSDVLGKQLTSDEKTYTIVGVAPSTLAMPMSPDNFRMHLHEAVPGVWTPARLEQLGGGAVFAVLRDGYSAERASREIDALKPDGANPTMKGLNARALRSQDFLDPQETRAVEILFVAVGVLLLIACGNVANLLMSRSWTRRREFAVRMALGAARARIVRQILTESLLLAFAGGALGIAVAAFTLRVIVALRPPALQNLDSVHIEVPVLLWSAGISIVTGVLFGCAPAIFAGRRYVGDMLRSEARAGAGSGNGRRMRSVLVVLEIALSLVLLVGAGLLVRSFTALQRRPLGFTPHGLVSADLLFARPRMSREAKWALRSAILERVRTIPGVDAATSGTLPGDGWGEIGRLEGDPDPSGRVLNLPEHSVVFAGTNYFRMTGLSFVEGQAYDSLVWAAAIQRGERPTTADVVVNRRLAQYFWPQGGAIGSHLFSPGPRNQRDEYTVVGVVGDVRMPGPQQPIQSMQLFTLPVIPQVGLVLHTSLNDREIAGALRRAIADVDPSVIVRGITSGDKYVSEAMAPTRFAMALLAAFSVVALILSAIGLYGVVAYSVVQRTHEIGVRVALGAMPGDVTALVIGNGLRLAAAGAAIGVVVSLGATRMLSTLLVDVRPGDPGTLAAITALVVAIALLASYVPARRAVRIDPTDALRAD